MGAIEQKDIQNTLMTISGSTYVHYSLDRKLTGEQKEINGKVIDALQELYFSIAKANGIEVDVNKFKL